MPARYAPLPNPHSAPDADQELHDAFGESDNEDNDDGRFDTESTPLTHNAEPKLSEPVRTTSSTTVPGAYDFEREYDYDYPPPGSPPRPSAIALPNDYGNSNGQVPTSPVLASAPRPSFFRRAVGAILPTHYARVPVEPGRARGGGIENDGVFANVMAKPARARTVRTEDGSVHMVPEDNQAEAPPSYNDAQADAVPPYWETTVHAPGFESGSDMIVDDLPSGSLFIFAANLFTSFFFQFVGFILTYLLHTSHAAKYGSRAGLGLTLIQYGFYSHQAPSGEGGYDAVDGQGSENSGLGWPSTLDGSSDPPSMSTTPSGDTPTETTTSVGGVTSREWLSFLLMTLGWFLLLSSFFGFWRIKRWERSIRAAAAPAPITREDIERDIAVRRNIQSVFGFGFSEEDERREARREERRRRRAGGTTNVDSNGTVIVIPDQQALEEARLTRDLRAAGLL